jgi:hypothetical protein
MQATSGHIFACNFHMQPSLSQYAAAEIFCLPQAVESAPLKPPHTQSNFQPPSPHAYNQNLPKESGSQHPFYQEPRPTIIAWSRCNLTKLWLSCRCCHAMAAAILLCTQYFKPGIP